MIGPSIILSSAVMAIAWLWLRFAKREVSQPIWSTIEIPAWAEEESPLVSIIIMASHHAPDRERCLQSLLRQNYPRFEVLVVVPTSHNGDWDDLARLAASADGRLQIIRQDVAAPAGLCSSIAGWQLGVEAARGDWLLFTTMTTYHAPELLSRAMAYARLQGLGLLTLAPRYECRSFWEHVWHPMAFQYLAFIRPLEQMGAVKGERVWASEAFLLVAREAFTKAGGHVAGVMAPYFVARLLSRVKSFGYRVEFVRAMDLLQTRPYRHLRDLWQGWSQHLYWVLGAHPLRAIAHAIALVLWAVVPFAALVPAFSFGFWGLDTVQGWWDIVLAVSAILAVVTILQAESVVRRVHRQNHFYTPTLPLGGLCLAAAVVSGVMRRQRANGQRSGISVNTTGSR